MSVMTLGAHKNLVSRHYQIKTYPNSAEMMHFASNPLTKLVNIYVHVGKLLQGECDTSAHTSIWQDIFWIDQLQ